MLYGAGMVDSSVCRQTDQFILSEGFASFPSGHSSGGIPTNSLLFSYDIVLTIGSVQWTLQA